MERQWGKKMARNKTRKDWKKAIERYYLNQFQKLTGWNYEFKDFERPDFLARASEGTIGVEVTQLFKDGGENGSTLKRGEVRNARFLHNVAKEYYAKGGKPIRVTALLPATPDADAIPALIRRLERHRPVEEMDQKRFEAELTTGCRSVFYVTSLPMKFTRYLYWDCATDSTGWVARISSDRLSSKIREKAKKLPEYRKSADRVILLIVVDRTKNSGMLEFDEGTTPLPNCGFDEVHLLIDPLKSSRIA